MNARQSVLIAMFLSVAVYLLANAQATSITANIGKLKQVPATPTPVPPGGGFSGGTSGGNSGGAAGGAF